MSDETAGVDPVDGSVRPRALLLEHKDGRATLHPMSEYAVAYRDSAVSESLLYDQTALDAAVAAERERQQTVLGGYERIYNDAMRALRETVDERDKLRSYLVRYRDEVPLGHQPHMMAHLVDDALGRA